MDLDLPESFIQGMRAASRGACPYCCQPPRARHDPDCRFIGRVPGLEEQPHQPEGRAAGREK